MEKLNELVELAEKANAAGQGTPEMFEFRVVANPDNILAIAEAFRALEQREEAAEPEKQEPIYQYMTVSMLDETWIQERWIDCSKQKFDESNSECEPTRIVYAQQQPLLSEGLHPETAELVMQFAEALARKLRKSEQKYGWSDGWKDVGWQDKCLADFYHHISKGDPRDVAAYCAFMWYHGWNTQSAPAIDLNAVRAEGAIAVRNALVVSGDGSDIYAIATEVIDQLRAGNAGKDGCHE